jgi:hypothetical protein
MAKSQKYSAEMETVLRQAVASEPLNLQRCKELSEMEIFAKAEITPKSLVAKVRSMGLAYNKVERTTKTGEAVLKKDEIVQEIETALGMTGLDSLAKAEKPALRALAARLAEMASVDA